MDGFDASEQILKITKDAGQEDYCHIVALTSYTGDDVRRRVLNIGVKELVNKPLHHKQLQMMVYLHFYRLSLEEYKLKFPEGENNNNNN